MKSEPRHFLVIFLFLSIVYNYGCVNAGGSKDNPKFAVESLSEAVSSVQETEKFIVEGIVTNVHAEYFHTIVGLKTDDGKLLNLIFPGIYMQFGAGLYCRVTYHRLNDTGYLPELLRNQRANYFYLDNVELLDNNTGANK